MQYAMIADSSSAMANCWFLCLMVLCAGVSLMDAKPVLQDMTGSLPARIGNSLLIVSEGKVTDAPDSEGMEDLQDALESTLFTAKDQSDFASKLHGGGVVVDLSEGCGRGKNRLGMLADGTRFCCRYRDLQWQDIRGELYAYHLNKFLGMYNTPPATLIKVNFSSPQWLKVAPAAREAGWSNHMTIIATLFVEELIPETFPPVLKKNDPQLVTSRYLDTASREERSRILQWSDLIVFDFLIGHSDRIFNSLFNLQWNKGMMKRPVHNLLKTKEGDKLLLFDNESGFWLGYRMGWREVSKYEMQASFLRKLCIFRERTLQHLRSLSNGKQATADSETESPSQRFERYIEKSDHKSFEMVKPLSREQQQEFESRLKIILEQVQVCAEKL